MRKKTRIVPKRAAGKKRTWFKDFGAVFFVMLFFPYIIQLFFHGTSFQAMKEKEEALNDTIVVLETNIGSEKLPLEEYLVGALAASINTEYGEEALKAQTVLLRTSVLYERENREKGGEWKKEGLSENEVGQKALLQNYWNPTQMHRVFGENYETEYLRLKEIVKKTQSIVLTYEGKLIETPFCAVTAGTTREGKEALGGKEYPYLHSVVCESDVLSENYIKNNTFTWEEIEILVKNGMDIPLSGNAATESGNGLIENGNILKDQNKAGISGNEAGNITESNTMEVLKRDGNGYALSVRIGSQVLSGEECRRLLGLNSSNMQVVQTGENLSIQTKGLGHGVGMSQYTADYLAGQGRDFVEILSYFFKNTEIEKN